MYLGNTVPGVEPSDEFDEEEREERDQRAQNRAEGISEQIAAKGEQNEREYHKTHAVAGCKSCQELIDDPFGPSHKGSTSCESGSIASGGKESHCVCDVCF